MKIALLGTRGVPARYGGFETAVEEVGTRLVAAGEVVTVYCRNEGQSLAEYRGMRLVNLPALRRKSLETLSHTGASVLHAVRTGHTDVAFLFNAANAPLVPVLKAARIPVAVHLDGLEWKRAKWHGLGARYYRWAERASVGWADAVIADARGIADHVRQAYGAESEYIPYGAPILQPSSGRIRAAGLTPGGYHLAVARFEPENHLDMVIEGYLAAGVQDPLVVVGSAPYGGEYLDRIEALAQGQPGVRMLGAVWDQAFLDELYAGCSSYLHGHSVGGTNPSLLRAMGCGASVIAFDVNFNQEVTGGRAAFFADASQVAVALEAVEGDRAAAASRGELGRDHVAATYRWDDVAEAYLKLAHRLAAS